MQILRRQSPKKTKFLSGKAPTELLCFKKCLKIGVFLEIWSFFLKFGVFFKFDVFQQVFFFSTVVLVWCGGVGVGCGCGVEAPLMAFPVKKNFFFRARSMLKQHVHPLVWVCVTFAKVDFSENSLPREVRWCGSKVLWTHYQVFRTKVPIRKSGNKDGSFCPGGLFLLQTLLQ